VAWASEARASDPRSSDVPSVFFVAKSENKNQVHYGLHLDSRCVPVGDRPVFAYWRMLEHGPAAIEPLLPLEMRAYGIAGETVLERGETGGRVRVTLAALPDRPIDVEAHQEARGCVATATTTLAGARASLGSVYVRLRWPFGVDSLTLTGRAAPDGHVVREILRP
jgi:hypothetical protein